MDNTKQININNKLDTLFKGTGLEDLDYRDIDNAEEVIEQLETQINENEVIYYSNAIEYLTDNDPSLRNSLKLAGDLGYKPEDLDSEKLATILQQENLTQELNGLRKEIEEIFEEIFAE